MFFLFYVYNIYWILKLDLVIIVVGNIKNNNYTFYNYSQAVNHILNIFEPISIVLLVSVELKLLGPLFSITWRFFFDNELSNMLEKFIDILDVLKQFNSEVILKTKIFWIFITGVLVHFMMYITSLMGYYMATPDYSALKWVSILLLVSDVSKYRIIV